MTPFGIDRLAFYTPPYYLDLTTLAEARGIDPAKFHRGLGQYKMAFPSPDEDIITMAASAAEKVLEGVNRQQIDHLLFATESGVDQSKAAGIFLHKLLNLPGKCRTLELKQACYSATAGLQLAIPMLMQNPDKKILLVASDIARYGLNTPGESSQGAGAVALLITANPRLIAIDAQSGYHTEDAMDFWRPNYKKEAIVAGKKSVDLYLKLLKLTWQDYTATSNRHYHDFERFLFHIPFPKLAEKGYQKLAMTAGYDRPTQEELTQKLEHSLTYSRMIGNCYTASLMLGLCSLLENSANDFSHKRFGFYSYGSGAVAEFFSGVVQPDYQKALFTDYHQQLLSTRKSLSINEYESFYNYLYPIDGDKAEAPCFSSNHYRFHGLDQHKRMYGSQASAKLQSIKVQAPGKLILSGEHAVVHGAPAIVMAINRHAITSIFEQSTPGIAFDLLQSTYQKARPFSLLKKLKHRLEDDYDAFLQGKKGVADVIKKPFELLEYTATKMIDKLGQANTAKTPGFKVKTQSTIPTGCGMGSSAATITSTNYALAHFFEQKLSEDQFYQLGLNAENLQHGKSSGLDLQAAMQGGMIKFTGKSAQRLALWPALPLWMINTGARTTSAGQCVEKVKSHFEGQDSLLDEFSTVTLAIEKHLSDCNLNALKAAICQNHRLLVKIGVVPERIQLLVQMIEGEGGAAKICGAGAIEGDSAGMLLVVHDTPLTEIVHSFGFELEKITIAPKGVEIVEQIHAHASQHDNITTSA